MFDKLIMVQSRYNELNELMAKPDVANNPELLRQSAQEQAEIEDVVQTYNQYQQVERQLGELEGMHNLSEDDEMRQMVHEEIENLQARKLELETELRRLLLPRDPNDNKNVIVEIRAGAGGDEAGLFAADLCRMYSRYAEARGWKTQLLSSNESGIGGFKEVIMLIKGHGAYSRLKYEIGVHRVQRVPETESSGRIHTSTATVAILPEMEEVEVIIDPNELRIDIYRSKGPGGQSVNTTDSAVRITHVPTGLVVTCQDEKSQLQNKLRALSILRARLYDQEQQRQLDEVGEARRSQVGSADRSRKIRTYNFPQSRITDHRINYSSHRMEQVLNGDLDEFIERLIMADQAEKLAETTAA